MVRPAFLKLAILSLTSIITLFVSFVLISHEQVTWWTKNGGYWMVFATTVAFAWFFIQIVRKEWRDGISFSRHRWGVITIIICSVFLHLHEPHRFKILFDEYVLLSNSLRMHAHREVFITGRAHYINSHLQLQQGFVDKRPYFFSFVLSMVHDLTGYRLANAFILNGILTVILTMLMYALCWQIGGVRYGCLGVLLLTAIPLVAQNATGGGFEIMNAAMLLLFMTAASYYLKQSDDKGLNFFISTAVLLAQTRYESILYLLALAFIVLVKWISRREVSMNWFSACSPFLLFPPLLTNQVILSNRGFWQLSDPESTAFGLEHFVPNIHKALLYLFNYEEVWTNSFPISALGVIGLVFMFVYLGRHFREIFSNPGFDFVFYSTLLVMIINLTLLMTYHWGQLDDPMVWRLSLPLHLFFILSIIRVLKEFFKNRRLPNILFLLIIVYIIGFVVPANAEHEITDGYVSSREIHWASEYIRSETTEDTLVIAESSVPIICHMRASTPMYLLNKRLRHLQFILKYRIYQEVIVLQRFKVKHETLEEIPLGREGHIRGILHKGIKLETIKEFRVRPHIFSRISRVVGVNEADVEKEIELLEEAGEIWKKPTGFEGELEFLLHAIKMNP